MSWIGWLAILAAGGLYFAYMDAFKKQAMAHRAIIAAQQEVAKLSYLWMLEVKERRSLQDEYERPSISVQEECRNKFSKQADLYQLSNHPLFQDQYSPLDKHGLEYDPVNWAKQFVPRMIEIVGKFV